MIDKFNREKFMFEVFWLLLTGSVAFFKFQSGYNNKEVEPNYPIMFYTSVVFVIPILVNARFCTTLFLLKSKKKGI